jgi:hypothetical protein
MELGGDVNLAKPDCLIVTINATAVKNRSSTIRLLMENDADLLRIVASSFPEPLPRHCDSASPGK